MPYLKLGLRLDMLRQPVKQALRRAADLGVAGVQVSAVGELAPDQLSATGRRDFRRFLGAHGLELVGLVFTDRQGFNLEDGLEARVAALKQLLTMSYDLRAPVVTGVVGRIPDDPEHPARKLLLESVGDVGRHGERVGAVFAVETGSEPGATLRRFIDALGGAGVRASLDPAALLIRGYDPIQAVRDLNEVIVHAVARDAVREPDGQLGHEATPGDGELDWDQYLGALEEVGYHGWLTIDLRQSQEPWREASRAAAFLKRFGVQGQTGRR